MTVLFQPSLRLVCQGKCRREETCEAFSVTDQNCELFEQAGDASTANSTSISHVKAMGKAKTFLGLNPLDFTHFK